MKRTYRPFIIDVARIGVRVFNGCDKKGVAISSAEQADKKSGGAAPELEEAKEIAEDVLDGSTLCRAGLRLHPSKKKQPPGMTTKRTRNEK